VKYLAGFLLAFLVAALGTGTSQKTDEKLAAAESAFAKLQPELERAQAQWEKTDARFAIIDWNITRDLVIQKRLAGGNLFDGKRAIVAEIEHDESADLDWHDKFTLSAWILPTDLTGVIVTRGRAVTESEGYRVCLKDGRVQVNLVKNWRDDALRVETKQAVALDRWHNVTATYDGSGTSGGLKVYIDGQPQKLKIKSGNLHSSFESKEPLRIGGGGGAANGFHGRIRLVRIYRTVLTPDEVAVLATDTPVTALVQIPPDKRTAADSLKIRMYFLEHNAPANIREAWQRVCELHSQ
jgi:hypothetical protein